MKSSHVPRNVNVKKIFYYVEKSMVVIKRKITAYKDMIFANEKLDDYYILRKTKNTLYQSQHYPYMKQK